MSKNMYLDLHVIQTVPPSCVNRDDTGSPKTAIYGGTMRARVSSQAWKRAMRVMFRDLFSSEIRGYRTKNCVKLVADRMMEIDGTLQLDEAQKQASEILEMAGVKAGGDKKDVLFLISAKQVEAVADIALEYAKLPKADKKKMEKSFKEKAVKALNDNPSVDILLFGRMAASNPLLNYDAAAQVAHSISTHTVSNEYDYFTAVDDCSEDDNAGAGHLGTVEFNSSTLYRYATVNIGELAENLSSDELGQTARGFTEAFIRSMPTGKQNSFANRTLPDLVYVTVRGDQPVNLVGAFEKPIKADGSGYVGESVEALIEYAGKVYKDYVSQPLNVWIIGGKESYPGEKVNLQELLNKVEETAANYFSNGE